MTADAGRELDERIAIDVMGIPREDWRFRCYVERHDRDEEWCYECVGLIGDAPLDVRIPARYSTEIADAWMVVEKMREGFGIGLHFIQRCVPTDGSDWTVCFCADFTMHLATADSAPLAICRAALVAIPRTDDGGRET